MPTLRGEFIRKLGCLNIHVQRLNHSLTANEYYRIEDESQVIQDLVIDLIKNQRRLSKQDQRTLRPRFSAFREEALRSLENSRHVLDESLEAALSLLRTVQEACGYNLEDSDPPITGPHN
jgi:hypothetical protein